MKRSVRPQFIVLLLVVTAATFGYMVAVRNVFGPRYKNGSEKNRPLDFPLFNSTLLKLAEVEVGDEANLRKEIEQLLQGNHRVWISRFRKQFRQSLTDWARKKRFEPEIMNELIDQVKVPIDNHNGNFTGLKKKYESCAVVGSSGILLNKQYGGLIDSHEAVIRLKNAPIVSYQKNVGSRTSISFIHSIVLHVCAGKDECFCHPYGTNIPIVLYMCQPVQFLDYVVCNSSHKSPLIVTDPRFDVLCARVVKYYSLKRSNKMTFEQWNSAHDYLFHYSSGMQAVMLALGISYM